jgi:ubiquinone/menaquinone biosynthesis C-methylase UbiE
MQQENEWILEDFFSFIAPIYESKFHYQNNISCCDHLINLALKHKISDKSITLDFGSGTGIIIDSSFVSKLESIIGFDFCGEMRKLSRNRGMRTLSVFEFNSLPSNQFDIIILNYVLHLGISFNSLNHLLKFLVQGGVLVGNIHKDLGVNTFRDWLNSLLVNKFSHQIEISQHGSIIIIKKI